MEDMHSNVTRRSRKVKNLEREVELILSQDESEEEQQPESRDRQEEEPLMKTPSTKRPLRNAAYTPRPTEVLQDILQTPRRSCRKSVKPPQDYDDIIVRQSTRSTKKKLDTLDDNDENLVCPGSDVKEHQAKWSAADVGRSSSKRTRKSRRTTRGGEGGGRRNLNDSKYMESEAVHIPSDKTEEMIETVPAISEVINTDGFVNADNEEKHLPVSNANEEKLLSVSNANEEKNIEEEDIHLVQEDTEDAKNLEGSNHEAPVSFQEFNCTISSVKEEEVTQEIVINSNQKKEVEEVSLIQKDTKFNVVQQDAISQIQELEDESKINLSNESEKSNENIELLVVEEENVEESQNKNVPPSLDSSPKKEDLDANESFGMYLKSKDIDMEDLGLNPIEDEEEVEEDKKNIVMISADKEMTEDMPSLIVCDDEDEQEKENIVEKKPKLNTTFEAESSVEVVVEAEETNSQQSINSEATEMDALQISEDEDSENITEPVRKATRFMLTTSEDQNQTLLSTPPRSIQKPHRMPTPYRTRSDNKSQKNDTNVGSATKNSSTGDKFNVNSSGFTTLTPKEIVLRGIRKRSMSVCLGTEQPCLTRSAKKLKRKAVNFYSPANQTAIIEDLDKMIEKSIKKFKPDKEINRSRNVTTRRKRSVSCDDPMALSQSLCVISKLPRPVTNQISSLNATITSAMSTASTSASKPARTKLPNFAAIHQKQFQKMENLADHVARKQERSKILINSASKIRTASAQKNIAAAIINKHNHNEKPKALKKIDMTTQSLIQKKPVEIKSFTPKKIVPNQVKKPIDNVLNSSRLPDPKNAKFVIKPKQILPPKNHLKPTQAFNISYNPSSSLANTTFKQKPAFNLSTHIGSTVTTQKSATSLNSTTIESKTTSVSDKMNSRLQRHMDLFKGRLPASRAGVASRRNEAAIKGVRSNRRFELQMQHRKNTENA
ncbi:mitotic spindle and nuclear protein [Haematobia irritans]|uniref:mitotic spindle and nuclear protein n=1 Tax=Haematobia irritans TaxID=7368 RepID=UPI003F4FACFA